MNHFFRFYLKTTSIVEQGQFTEKFIEIVLRKCCKDEVLNRAMWKEQIRKADPTMGIIILSRQEREDTEILYGVTYEIIFSIKQYLERDIVVLRGDILNDTYIGEKSKFKTLLFLNFNESDLVILVRKNKYNNLGFKGQS